MGSKKSLRTRVVATAESTLAKNHYVTPIDVLLGLRWLHSTNVDRWRQGRGFSLENVIEVDRTKVAEAMDIFLNWARHEGLEPSETEYLARSRGHIVLKFTDDDDATMELLYRIHWVSPSLPESERKEAEVAAKKPADLLVISPLKEFTCEQCGGTGAFLIMEGPGPLCMDCADMSHLVFLPAGNAALTRRSKKLSHLWAVVVRYSRSRKRYERQGLLVEEAALEEAEAQCLADDEVRARRRERDAARREIEDDQLRDAIANEILLLFPGCPKDRAEAIARHTATRGSGRVGRTADARALEARPIELAVGASVRHRDTDYDTLVMSGMDRHEARAQVGSDVTHILEEWRQGPVS
ncbi:MAG: DUF2293 domain-containing protein [Acidimicrobiia bacterium]|nr:DUF2293 domain-containing protein [Acidimicrobiia bacterium]